MQPLPFSFIGQHGLFVYASWKRKHVFLDDKFTELTRVRPVKPVYFFPALNMTSASSFQMLRGAVIIFTGLLSVAFLGRRLAPSQWLGIFITIMGLVIVGLADFFSGHKDDTHKLSDVITGKVDF